MPRRSTESGTSGPTIPNNPVHQGFDEFIGFKSGNVDYRNYYDTSGNADWWEGETLKASTTQGYLTELISAHSLDFVRRNKRRRKKCLPKAPMNAFRPQGVSGGACGRR